MHKFAIGDKVKTYVHGRKEQGTVIDHVCNEGGDNSFYYVKLGRAQHVWSLPGSLLRPIKQFSYIKRIEDEI